MKRCTIKDRKRAADLLAVKDGCKERQQKHVEAVGLMSDDEVLKFIEEETAPAAVEVEEIRPDTETPEKDLFKICDDLIKNYLLSHNLEAEKITPLQWAACCMACGRFFRSRSWFRVQSSQYEFNNNREVNARAVAAAVPVWLNLCYTYNKTPLICDFCEFVGISEEWLYKTGADLTPERVQIYKNLKKIQENGLRRRVINPKESPIGPMFLLKADHGLIEATKVQHEYIKPEETGAALPDFGQFQEITDKNGGF